MTAAAPAKHLRSLHKQAVVGTLDDGTAKRTIKTRPAGAAVELGRRAEQRKRAPRAEECAAAILIVQGARECPFGPRFAQDSVTFRAKPPLPFRGRMGDFEVCRGGLARRWTKHEPADPAECDGAQQCTAIEISSHGLV